MAKDWQGATLLNYASPSHPWKALGRSDAAGKVLREERGRVHCGSMTLAGCSDAAHGDQSTGGKCRLGYVIGLLSSTLKDLCRISQ